MRLVLILAALAALACLALYTPDRSRAWLIARYGTAEDSDIDAAGVRLRVRQSGPADAPPIILLHGFGASLQTWDGWTPLLARHHRVIAFDLPGFGLTGADPTGDYTDARAVTVLLALMDRLGIARADLVGNSLGGKLAWLFAAAHPDRVDRLVLISPDGFASPGFEYGRKPDVPWLLRLLPYTLPRALVRLSLAPAYADRTRLTAATVSRYRDFMRAPGVRAAMLARLGQVMLRDPAPVLATIHRPVLLLWGTQDGMIPFANAQDYARDLPDARIAALPGLGHVPFEEAPAWAFEPVEAFLRGG